jgi:ATP-binding cassette subfamily C protein CydC
MMRMVSSFKIVRRLLSQMHGQARWLALATLLGILTIASGIGLLTLSAYLISEAALHPPLAALAVAIVGVRLFGIVRGIFRYLERLVSHSVIFRLLARLRVWFYRSLEPLAPARLMHYAEAGSTAAAGGIASSGDLLSRFVADIDTLQEFYVRVISPPIVALLIGFAMWYILDAYNILFALTLLACYLLAGVGVPVFIHALSRRLGQRLVLTRATLNMALIDSVQGMADLLACGQEGEQIRRVQQLNRELVRLQTRMAWIEGLHSALSIVCSDGCVWVMLLAAIPLVRSGALNGVFLALVALAALASFEAVQPLSMLAQQFGGSLAAARRLFAVVDAQPAIHDPVQSSPVPADYSLDVRHLSFRYSADGPDVLHDISFSLQQGQCLAIVGPSGAGKSTLAHVLLRFWEYERGAILLGGHELRAYQQQEIHRLISVVEQHTHLFNATIRENLLIARVDASMEQIVQAAQQAQIHEFIQALPQGYETPIGEQGLKLSGGERQRLAIARAFLKDAPILLLDEATANLDALSEQQIMRALHSLRQGRTTIMITHRLTGLELADEILVLQDGAIRERGSHHELVQAEGLYWRAWQLQRQLVAPG